MLTWILRPTNMKKILQNISIVGFENIAFHEALLATHQVYRLFEQSHPPGAMKPFQFSNIQAEPSFVAQARFLTPAQNNPFSEAEHDIRISQDPRGHLQQLVNSGNFFYTDDNEVEFQEANYCLGLVSLQRRDGPKVARNQKSGAQGT
jgi:hypothetical protein